MEDSEIDYTESKNSWDDAEDDGGLLMLVVGEETRPVTRELFSPEFKAALANTLAPEMDIEFGPL